MPGPQRTVGAGRLAELLGYWRGGGHANARLAGSLRALILDGRLPPGTRLAPERALAVTLGTSRNTVTAAYDRLRDEGYLVSRRGSGTVTGMPGGHRFQGDATVPPGARFDLTVAALPAPPELPGVVAAAAGDLPRWLDHHGYHPLGLPPLRAALAAGYTARGLPTDAEEILVTGGALHALQILTATLVRPRDAVLVEVPGYPAAFEVFRTAGARLVPVAVTARGWDLDQLASTFARTRPALAYLVPEFHNPTGALLDTAGRRVVAAAAARGGGFLVADETAVDLAVDPGALPAPLVGTDPRRSLNVGSLSKGYWGGLRVGWIRADAGLVQRLAHTRALTDLAGAVIDQLVAVRLLRDGAALLAGRRAALRERRGVLLGALTAHFPDWRTPVPAGGPTVWTELPTASASLLADRALAAGVVLTPGPRFGLGGGTLERFLRLPYVEDPRTLRDAIAALAAAAGPTAPPTTAPADFRYS
jgi:DNA-binding transcriptional MocR family regulator